VVAGLLLAAVYLGLALIRRVDMGLGDIKLAAVLGTGMGWLSWNAVLAGTFLKACSECDHACSLPMRNHVATAPASL
jgi:prepilin signal peptidase PulO-like enzyme (type II secretory pathway)